MVIMTMGAGWAQELDEDARFDAATKAVRDRDFRLAINLFEPLAEADVADAQYNLAVLLRAGRGRPQNHVEALYWSALALLSDGDYAKDMVSELLERLPLTAREAVVARLLDRLMAQAAAGQMDAPRKLARVYSELSPEPDARLAYIWYSICHALGENRCGEARDQMAEEIDPDDLIQVQIEAGTTFAGLPFATMTEPELGANAAQDL
jgi:TPR repeat protein